MNINFDNVLSVYSGVNGKCCCGCAGKHTYREGLRELATRSRGYEVTPSECSDRSVKLIIKKIEAAAQSDCIEYVEEDMVSAVVGNRLYIAYFAHPSPTFKMTYDYLSADAREKRAADRKLIAERAAEHQWKASARLAW